jgi:hypothetical protein
MNEIVIGGLRYCFLIVLGARRDFLYQATAGEVPHWAPEVNRAANQR